MRRSKDTQKKLRQTRPGLSAPSRKQLDWQLARTGSVMVQERHDTISESFDINTGGAVTTTRILAVPTGFKASITYLEIINRATGPVNLVEVYKDSIRAHLQTVPFTTVQFEYAYLEAIRVIRSVDIVLNAGAPAAPALSVNIRYILEPLGDGYFIA